MLRTDEPGNGCCKPLGLTTRLLLLSLAGLLASAAEAQEAFSPCGALRSSGQYGPYDSRKDPDKLPIVLGAHFTPEVEALIRGRTSATPGGDIDYTLRAIPNHHRALVAMMRLGQKERTTRVSGANYSVECYFERAIRFAQDDEVVRMIYATFLIEARRGPDAAAQLDAVRSVASDNPLTHYNLGLLYFDMKDYDKALAEAHVALGLGLPRSGLREKLVGVGRWAEPVPATAAAAGASAATATSAASAASANSL